MCIRDRGQEDIQAGITRLSDQVAARLRRYHMKCNGISLAIRDPAFRDIIRQQRLDSPSNLAREISQAAMGLAKSCWNMDHPVRALTVTALSLVPEEEVSAQLDLLAFGQDKKRERLEKLEETMDSIRAKYGKSSISHASSTQAAGGSGHAPPPGGSRSYLEEE